MNQRQFLILLAAIFVFAFWFRIRDLDRSSFWTDEVLGAQVVHDSFSELMDRLPPNKPPLDFWILHFMLKLNEDEFTARLPACIFGSLSILALAFMVWPMVRERPERYGIVLATAAFAATSAFHLRYSQEARPYALFFLCLVMAHGFWLRIMERRSGAPWLLWVGFGVFSLLGMLTLYFTAVFLAINLALVIALLAIAIVKAREASNSEPAWLNIRSNIINAAGISGVIALCLLVLYPLTGRIHQGMTEETHSFGKPSIGAVVKHSKIFGVSYHDWDLIEFGPLPTSSYFLPFAVVGLVALFRYRREFGWYCSLHMFGSMGILLVAYWIQDHWVLSRYFLIAFAPYYFVLAMGAVVSGQWLQKRLRWAPVLLPTAALCLFSVALILKYPSFRYNWRGLARFAEKHAVDEQTALITFRDIPETRCVQYYLDRMGSDIPIIQIGEDVEEVESVLRKYPHSFLYPLLVQDKALSRWLGTLPQLSWKRHHVPMWYTFAPRRLFLYEDVRERAINAFQRHGMLDFGNEGFDFLGSGWETREGTRRFNFRWAIQKESEVFLWVEDPADYRVTFRAQPLSWEGGWPGQHILFLVNGRRAARVSMEGGINVYEFFLPADHFQRGLNTITMRFDYVRKVSEIEGRDDSRKLAALFDYMTFKPGRAPEYLARLRANADAVAHVTFDGNHDYLMGEGWSYIEDVANQTYRWTNSLRSEFYFNADEKQPLIMRFKAVPFLYPDWPGQSMEIYLNGHFIEGLELEGQFWEYEVSLPAEAVVPATNRMEFRFSRIDKVSDLKAGSMDHRQLAVRFDYIYVGKTGDSVLPAEAQE